MVILLAATKRLIQQHVAKMRSIRQVIYHHEILARRAHHTLPCCIQRIVIDNQPVRRQIMQQWQAERRIFFLRRCQPIGMHPIVDPRSIGHGFIAQWQSTYGIATPLNVGNQIALVFLAQEIAFPPFILHGLRQRQTAHHMSSTHMDGCINAKNDFHKALSALNNHSARSQSSCVSISCTRWRGNRMGNAFVLNRISPSSHARVRPQ